MTKLDKEYAQALTNKMKVAVLYAMLPKEMQDRILDACTVAWDGTNEGEAGLLYQRVKSQVKNMAKARREVMGPKPMEVDIVSGSWADYAEEEWDTCWTKTEGEHQHEGEYTEAVVQYIGEKGGKSGGKGFQGSCYVCGEYGHSQRFCPKGKGKGGGKDGYVKGGGKDGMYKSYSKGFSKDSGYKGYGKGYGKEGWYQGKGYPGKGGAVMPRACFGCGSTEHILKDCPKNPMKVQQVSEQEDILFIGQIREDWKTVPMKVKTDMNFKHKVGGMGVAKPYRGCEEHNRFKVLQPDENDEDDDLNAENVGSMIFAVEATQSTMDQGNERDQAKFEDDMFVWGAKGAKESGVATPRQALSRSTGRDIVGHQLELKDQVKFVRAVEDKEGFANLGTGDIIVDSAADESCWPVGQGDAYPTKVSSKKLRLRTANGGEMEHYGQKDVLIKYKGGEHKDPIGLRFQVTDVKKPLLAVRRLVEKGNVVVLSNVEGESYILNKEAKVRIPIVKKGGSFVVEAQFVLGFGGQA
jgi:hypothetical protein